MLYVITLFQQFSCEKLM